MTGHEGGRVEEIGVGGQAHRPGPGTGGGLGEHRPARLPGQAQQRRGVAAAVAADDHAALGPRQFQGTCPGGAAGKARPWPPVRAAVQWLGPAARRTALARGVRQAGHQRLTQRQVQVHRPGEPVAGARGGRPGTAGQRPPVGVHARPRLRHPGLAEPADRVPVQLDLVDGLVRAGAAQLRRPVGGEHEQRYPGLACLDHGRVEVRRRGPRGADQRDRPPARLGQAEREKRGRPLVDPHMQPQCCPGGTTPRNPPLGRKAPRLRHGPLTLARSPRVLRAVPEGDGQRRAAGPRCQHGLRQPAPGQLVHQRGRERRGRVHGASRYRAAASARARHGAGSVSHAARRASSTLGRATGSMPACSASGAAVTSPSSRLMVASPQA